MKALAPTPAALVPDLLSLIFGETGAVRDGAVAVVERALAAATPADLLWLDEACRRASGWVPGPRPQGWRALTPTAVAELDRPGAVAVVGVASFHPFGHVREAAVRRLGASLDA